MENNVNFPLVSVITATKNIVKGKREIFFRKAAASIKEQDYPNIEHIVIDGASDDGSVEMFKQMGLNYISELDKNTHDAYNKGIKRSSGKYIFFLNADDFFVNTDSVSRAVHEMEKTNADFTCASVPVFDENNNLKEIFPVKIRYMFLTMPFGFSGVMLRRDSVVKIRMFDESFRIASDYDLIWRMFSNGFKCLHLDFNLGAWRGGGISDSNPQERIHEYMLVFAKNTGLSIEESVAIMKRKYIPHKILKQIIIECRQMPDSWASQIYKKNYLNCLTWNIKKLFSFGE